MSLSWMAAQIAIMTPQARPLIECSPAMRQIVDLVEKRREVSSRQVANALGLKIESARSRLVRATKLGLLVSVPHGHNGERRWLVSLSG